MAIELKNKTNVAAPNATYPYGDLIDDTGTANGTPVSRQVYADFHQFFARLLALSGIAPNNLPDNASNGFQYFDALEALTGRTAWQVGANPVVAAPSTGVTLPTPAYNRYRLVGKTLYWKLSITNATISLSPTAITISGPIVFNHVAGATSAPKVIGLYNGQPDLAVSNDAVTGPNQVTLTRLSGSAFTNGTSNQRFEFYAVIEIA